MAEAFDPNDPTFQWVQAVHRDLVNLRDNHLAHVDADLQELKTEMRLQRHDLDSIKSDLKEVMPIIRDLQFFGRRFGKRILLALIAAACAMVGMPMVGIETL